MRSVSGNERAIARQRAEWGSLCLYILERVDSIRSEVEKTPPYDARPPAWFEEMMKAREICAQEVGEDDPVEEGA
jgi:hypothetical protein